ncbi:gliding motility-associated C-terminal domain-containing protein [Dyadobacter flavalbus]|uniref:Gliding motility-associated C-terminal domain-containing protein n=1 Tax=Dyadobacter flavalbus TaxID=2579942 RepID=A0A5M8QWF1_9BACT|nr:gliding motility-associated C-terminal domain-containing protein [Dyadobacter flavalbus]KAA6439144.1 gliding motility-associated C-terminal domain-containing protein [Dyadobacter flavalbus]
MIRNLYCFLLLLLLTWFAGTNAMANHIVGGELQMKPSGAAGNFEVTLIQIWDQNNLVVSTPNVTGNRDPEATLYIYRKKDDRMMGEIQAAYVSVKTIPYQNKACASIRSLNTSMGTYRGNIFLDPGKYNDPEGYYIIWERCCRNDDINNIVSPGDNGMVFYLEFPPVTVSNSSPEFLPPNGQYICSKRPFSMNMSATDKDGDELRYSLVTPYRGNTTPDDPYGAANVSNGYPLVTWSRGISLSNIIPGSSPLSVSNSGMLTVNANKLGLYVFTIQCEEYRNGRKIGVVRRDFQLLVIDCNDETPEKPVILYDSKPVTEVEFCPDRSIELSTASSQGWAYQWQQNGLNIPGAVDASIVVKDSGSYSVIKSFVGKCSRDTASETVHARFTEPILAVITSDNPVLCPGGVVNLTANGGNVANDLEIEWKKDNAILAHSGPVLSIRDAGTYLLKITNTADGCTGTDTTNISKDDINVVLPEKTGVITGASVKLVPAISPPNANFVYSWSPPEGLVSDSKVKDAVIAPQSDTQYILSVTSENGCVAEDSTLVFVIEKIHIPTTFSPNNDGHNDTFKIIDTKNRIEEVSIFNRWGEVIFHSKGYAEPWNGTFQNKPLPAGSYPYIIKAQLQQPVEGSILLLK